MKRVSAEVIGPNPPCLRCTAVKQTVETVANKLRTEGIEVEIKRSDILSREVVKRYGLLLSPALAVNGVVKVMGRIPDPEMVENVLREAAK